MNHRQKRISAFAYCREFIAKVWEIRKLKLYGKDTCPGPQSDFLEWDQGQDGRNGRRGHSIDVFDACSYACTHNNVDLHVNVCGSAQCWSMAMVCSLLSIIML